MTGSRFFASMLVLGFIISPYAVGFGDKVGKEGDKGIDDAKFVLKASSSDMAEIALGKIASKHAASSAVKSFAKHMVEDHTKSSKELMAIVTKSSLTAAKDMGKHHQEMVEKLASVEGAEFDRLYMMGQVKAHQEAVKLFTYESEHGQDADLKAFAAKTLPVIQHHLKMAQKIAGKSVSDK